MRQRQEHFLPTLAPGADRFLDALVRPVEGVLDDQPVEDPLGRVPLLLRGPPVGLQDLGNQRQIRLHLRPLARLRPSVSRRLDVAEDLLERLPVQPVLPARLALADLAGQHPAADFRPQLHVAQHSSMPRSMGKAGSSWRRRPAAARPDVPLSPSRLRCTVMRCTIQAPRRPARRCTFRAPFT